MATKTCLLSLLAVLSLAMPAITAESGGTTALDFLNIDVSARQLSLGGAGYSLDNGVASTYFNPAGLSAVDRPAVTFVRNVWYQDIPYDFLGFAVPVGDRVTAACATAYLHSIEMESYNSLDQPTGQVSAYGLAGIVSLSFRAASNLSLGVGARYLTEKLADIKATGYALDLGARYRIGDFDFGINAANIGPAIKYGDGSFKLPTWVSGGVSYSNQNWPLTFLLGARKPLVGKMVASAGVEYRLINALCLRTGVGLSQDRLEQSDVSFGVGLNALGGSFDYAYNPSRLLGGVHVFSFTVSFGHAREPLFAASKADHPAPSKVEQNQSAVEVVSEQSPKSVSYLVTAGTFADRESAQKQVEILKKLGFGGKIESQPGGDCKVVIARTWDLKKAEKIHSTILAKGLGSSIEIE